MQLYSLDSGKPLRIEGQVQRYAWGKVGAESRIAPFLNGLFIRDLPSESPLAEYWLGCHPKGESVALLPGGSRCALGEVLPDRAALPFMLKVLSVNPVFGLSIQAHPDHLLAQALHARDSVNYPDPFHKPEVGIALSRVTLLYNIKADAAIVVALSMYPEILSVLSERTRDLLATSGIKGGAALRRSVFVDCLSADQDSVLTATRSILDRHATHDYLSLPEEIVVMQRLSKTYGFGDVGLMMVLLMNLVSLNPGEAIFIGPNIPHAYLDGDLVECMACSDNVIRAGLTTKYRDVKTLIETTDYQSIVEPQLVEWHKIAPYHSQLLLPVEEFSVEVIDSGGEGVGVDLSGGHALVLCLGERAVVSDSSGQDCLSLGDGEAAILPRGMGRASVSAKGARLFVAKSRATV